MKILNGLHFGGTVLVAFAIAATIGLGLGLINALIISRFNLPTMIVTLGTASLYRGFLMFFIGSVLVRDLPQGMENLWRANLITLTTPEGALTHLHSTIFLLVAGALVTWFILNYTMLGRSIYALGGAREAAERAGFNVRRIQLFIYGFVGFMAGISGIVYGALNRQADPSRLVGTELDVIAAVVLGGALITGGRGSVIGTLLGVFLITIVNNSLILMGIPSIWQKVVIGLIIIVGTGLPAYRNQQTQQRLGANLAE